MNIHRTASPNITELRGNRPQVLFRAALIIAIYGFSFITLDFLTKQLEELPGIVAWYPPAGLTYAMLLVFGAKFAPVVLITLLASSLYVYRMPQPPFQLILWAVVVTLIYSLAAVFLRQRIHFDWQLRKLRDVSWFVSTTVVVSALLAVLSVSSSASSTMPLFGVTDAIFHWWIGETVGVLAVTPFLLVYVLPSVKRFLEGQPVKLPTFRSFLRPSRSDFVEASLLVITLFLVFVSSLLNEFHPMYLITLPLIWIAIRHGFKRITGAIVGLNIGVVLAMWFFQLELVELHELALLMMVNCIVGLQMGAVVSERKQGEEEIRQLNAELEQRIARRTAHLEAANKDIASFTYSISHDLKIPVRAIDSFSQLLMDENQNQLNGEGQRLLEVIRQNTRKLDRLINDLLVLLRVSQSEPKISPIDMTSLVHSVYLEIASSEEQALFTFNLLPLGEVDADPALLRLIWSNLIANAIKYTLPKNERSIQVESRVEDGMITFSIQDSGVGFNPKYAHKLFGLFERLHRHEQFEGMGAGLAIVQRAVLRLGGKVWAEGVPDQGATFNFSIPKKQVTYE